MLDGKSDLTDFETDGNGKLTGAYLMGADGLISQTDYTGQSPVTSGYLYNPHGDTSATTDQNGNVTGTYRYDSFGNTVAGTPPADGFTGKWQREADSADGLIRMGAREYDPELGRFISPDSLKGPATDPQQRNRYPYVGSDPLSRYDLNGLYWGENYVDTALSFGEWLTGAGPDIQNFGPDSPEVQDMRESPGIQDAINQFYQQNAGRRCDQYSPKLTPEGFGLGGLINAGLNPTQQFVGGYEVDITPNQDHTITITVRNRTSMSSALYHIWPESWNYNRLNIGGVDLPTPGANTYQTFTWTEPMR
jgi:RHS repeat-associated protein